MTREITPEITPEQAKAMAVISEGAIVGSAGGTRSLTQLNALKKQLTAESLRQAVFFIMMKKRRIARLEKGCL